MTSSPATSATQPSRDTSPLVTAVSGKGRGLRLTADNDGAGWPPIAALIADGGAFAVPVRTHILAIDADPSEHDDPAALHAALHELAAACETAGTIPLVVDSGRDGHRHLFAGRHGSLPAFAPRQVVPQSGPATPVDDPPPGHTAPGTGTYDHRCSCCTGTGQRPTRVRIEVTDAHGTTTACDLDASRWSVHRTDHTFDTGAYGAEPYFSTEPYTTLILSCRPFADRLRSAGCTSAGRGRHHPQRHRQADRRHQARLARPR